MKVSCVFMPKGPNEPKDTANAITAGKQKGDDFGARHVKINDKQKKREMRSVIVLSVLLVVLLMGVGIGCGYLFWQQGELDRTAQQMKDTPKPSVDPNSSDSESGTPVKNPIDFASLHEQNTDVFAWIYVPGTDVNLPVVQDPSNDYFYLDHNVDKNYAVEGAVYTELANHTDFSDPVTVIYGHNLQNKTMFSTLHNFENQDFFKAHDTFYIYRPGHILTYRVVSAYLYDDRHILNSYKLSDPTVRENYFNSVMHPDSLVVNTRDDTKLSIDDKIIQLSTCMSDTNHTSNRYLVSGVLIDDQTTS